MSTPVVQKRTERRPFAADPAALYRALSDGDRDGALLEFGRGSTPMSRRSLVVSDPALRVEGRGRTVRIETANACGDRAIDALRDALAAVGELDDGSDPLHISIPKAPTGGRDAERLVAPSPVDVLRVVAFAWESRREEAPSALQLPGVFSYDLVDTFEKLPANDRDPLDFPDFVFWLPRTCIAVDHESGATQVHRFDYGTSDAPPDLSDDHPFERALATLDAVEQTPAKPPPAPDGADRADVSVDDSDEEYARLVRELQEHIAEGEIFQAVPSRTFRTRCPDAFGAYLRLRRQNPSPYSFFVRRDGDVLFGASPETSVRVDPDRRTVDIRPIAGTRGRGRRPDGAVDPVRDACLEAELRLDDKELAEHSMLVDLARNDVARVSRPGSVRVDRLMGVDRFSDVMHLVSHVRGRLEPELDALHAYTASMNMGTLVGAPKLRAAELLRNCEETARGPYGGAVGFLRADGALETAIVIRAAVVPEGTRQARVRAGAGIVADSDPAAEADETRAKADAVLRAIRGAPAPSTSAEAESGSPVDALVVDNFDSFTFNLADIIGRRAADVEVWRNDAGVDRLVERVASMTPPRLVLFSPGPGRPDEAGCCPELLRALAGEVPILGICLGHQVVVEAFGGRVDRHDRPVHGESSAIHHCRTGLFDGLDSPIAAGRYHSLVAAELPDALQPTARLDDERGTVMAVRHRDAPVRGLQFHPESMLTSSGSRLVANALDWARSHDGSGASPRTDDHTRNFETPDARRTP